MQTHEELIKILQDKMQDKVGKATADLATIIKQKMLQGEVLTDDFIQDQNKRMTDLIAADVERNVLDFASVELLAKVVATSITAQLVFRMGECAAKLACIDLVKGFFNEE